MMFMKINSSENIVVVAHIVIVDVVTILKRVII